MVFKCQSDSFLKEYSSKVVSCVESKFVTQVSNKEIPIDGYEVILEDTILFPEGGGQPADQGLLNHSKVYHVKRQGSTAVHYVDKPLPVGENVVQKVDWERRFDHMQQHSGQHLLSAIIDRDYGYNTASWWLGEQVSHVELDCPSFTLEQIQTTEGILNELIRLAKPVTVEVFNRASDLEGVKTRGLPEDHVGDVRVITIEEIDNNMCCGTHVTNLSQLQAIKLLGTEKSKRKNKTLLYFLVGNRVLKRLGSCLAKEEQLTALLKSNPADHPMLVEKLQKNLKTVMKDLQSILKDVAISEVQKYKSLQPPPQYYILHRREAEPDFMNCFIREVGLTNNTLFFLSVGEQGAGNIVLYGNENDISKLGNKITEMLDGKGAGKGNKFQAKVKNLKNSTKVEALLKEYFRQ